eukprot:GHVR01051792.1.p1 GENE.GHVR01051792.1~~GHVR01051792.1.p1  ORF type:complete len:257 (+),score=62.12 GHVR01051792.1:362-1132(+)
MVMIDLFRKQSERATAFWSAVSERLQGSGLHTRIATLAQTVEDTGASLSQAGTTLKASLSAAFLTGFTGGVLEDAKAVGVLVEALHEAVSAALAIAGSAASHLSEIMEGLRELEAYGDKPTTSAEEAIKEAHTVLEATVTVTESMIGESEAALIAIAKPCEDSLVDVCVSLCFRQIYTVGIAAEVAQDIAVVMRRLQDRMDTLVTHSKSNPFTAGVDVIPMYVLGNTQVVIIHPHRRVYHIPFARGCHGGLLIFSL